MTLEPIHSRLPNPVSWNDEYIEAPSAPETETPPRPDSPESPLRLLSRQEERALKILDAYVAGWIAKLEFQEYSSYELEVLERIKDEINF